jgi:hypothetical protein
MGKRRDNEIEQDPLPDDAGADARLRALFGEMDRPPLGDERFTAAVMQRVAAAANTHRQLRLAWAAGLGSLAVAFVAPHLGAGLGEVIAAVNTAFAWAPVVGSSAATLVLIGLAAAAGWAVAERA